MHRSDLKTHRGRVMMYGEYDREYTGTDVDGCIVLKSGAVIKASVEDREKMRTLGSFMFDIEDDLAVNIRHPETSAVGQDGVKYDDGKNRVGLIPILPLLEIGKVFSRGASKYDARNWEKGMPWSRVYDAALRHIYTWWAGERTDPEMRTHHLANAITNLLFLLEYDRTHPECDDRTLVNTPLTDDKIEEVATGDPGNPYKRKRMKGKWYWTWGFHLPWYVGTADEPPEKLRKIVAAIHAAKKNV